MSYKLGKNHGRFLSNWCNTHYGTMTWADIDGDGKADAICDEKNGNHYARLSNGNGQSKGLGLYLKGWCSHGGSKS